MGAGGKWPTGTLRRRDILKNILKQRLVHSDWHWSKHLGEPSKQTRHQPELFSKEKAWTNSPGKTMHWIYCIYFVRSGDVIMVEHCMWQVIGSWKLGSIRIHVSQSSSCAPKCLQPFMKAQVAVTTIPVDHVYRSVHACIYAGMIYNVCTNLLWERQSGKKCASHVHMYALSIQQFHVECVDHLSPSRVHFCSATCRRMIYIYMCVWLYIMYIYILLYNQPWTLRFQFEALIQRFLHSQQLIIRLLHPPVTLHLRFAFLNPLLRWHLSAAWPFWTMRGPKLHILVAKLT